MRFPSFQNTLPLIFALMVPITACKPPDIPGTEIPDTKEDRVLMGLVDRFHDDFQAKDVAGLLQLASPRYLDAHDSISYDTLKTQLQGYFDKVRQVHLDITIRRIAIEGDHARVDYVFSLSYLLDTNDPQWKSQTDDKRMTLERIGNSWKVTSGF